MKTSFKKIIDCTFALLLCSCAVGPQYQQPKIAIPANFKEADWKIAEPQDQAAIHHWWESYQDAALNQLVSQISNSNQNVMAALAQYKQASSVLQNSRGAYLPSITAGLNDTRNQNNSVSNNTANDTRNNVKTNLNISWELDLWGRIANSVNAANANAQASLSDLRAAMLLAQTTLVQTYMQLRSNDIQQDLLKYTEQSYQRALEMTENRYAAGLVTQADVAQAQTQLQSTRVQLSELQIQRAQYEHAIAVLIGKIPSEFSIAANLKMPTLPALQASIPSKLLEQRPDIAAAERRMAAANAQIGVAQAAFFPTINFDVSGGYQSTSFAHLFTLPNRFWSLGANALLTLFDGGMLEAQKQSAIAAYDKSVANYKQTVLTAFQEVEDQLASLRLLNEEEVQQKAALNSANKVLQIVKNQYEAGIVSYLNVISAQNTVLNAHQNLMQIQSRQRIAHANLIKALGGDV